MSTQIKPTTRTVVEDKFLCYVCRGVFVKTTPVRPGVYVKHEGEIYQASLCSSDEGECPHTLDEILAGKLTICQPYTESIPDFVSKIAERLWEEFDDATDPDRDEFLDAGEGVREQYITLARQILSSLKR